MGSSTVRISKTSSAILKEIASEERKTLQSILDDAIEDYRRASFSPRGQQGVFGIKKKSEVLGGRTGREKTMGRCFS